MLGKLRDILLPPQDLDPDRQGLRLVRGGLLIIAGGILGFALWTALAPLAGAVIAQGVVKVDMNRKVVQHQEGGIVKELLVRDGDKVQAGQTLMVIQDVRVDATLDLLRNQLDAENAKAARLEAERAFLPAVQFPKALLARKSEEKVSEIIGRETVLFRARRESVDSQIAVIRRNIEEIKKEVKALGEQTAAEDRALKLQQEELRVNEELLKQNFVQRTRVLALQRSVAEYEARHSEHQAELSRAQQRTSELELRILSMRNQYVQAAADELKETTSRLFDLEERLRPTKDAAERQRVTAPISGEVVGLRVFTAGGVVGPREVLMEVVPNERILIVEARLRPEDINYVRPGTEADVRLTAYRQRTTPLVYGKVNYVSGDRLSDQAGNSFYTVHVEVTPQALAEAGNLKLQAGMPAEVFMRTDQRSAFDYLTAPITAYFRRGMREPL
jgi:membrane fusion protein, epimerase transport system